MAEDRRAPPPGARRCWCPGGSRRAGRAASVRRVPDRPRARSTTSFRRRERGHEVRARPPRASPARRMLVTTASGGSVRLQRAHRRARLGEHHVHADARAAACSCPTCSTR
ncbi:MAG: hypothetical protein MZV64_30845 [Ignavibacteriales bacterium]|nr:hypothetical protein [Ignavibacteriales bacterium]